MIREQAKIQIGKNGLTDGVITQIKNILIKKKSVRVSMLKTAVENKEKAKEISDKVMAAIGSGFRHRLIGHTMVIHRFTSGKSFALSESKLNSKE